MTKKEYTNRQLASDYFLVTGTGQQSSHVFGVQRQRIQECSENIAEHYQSHNYSLKELCSPGIGSQTKSKLELILRLGVTKTRELEAQKEKRRRRYRHLFSTQR